MAVLLVSVAGLVLYLLLERIRIDRWRQSVPQTISVTGTRGKSSVTRLLASVLRADGRRVLAKTTGSSPTTLWPDGSETEIRRRGPASILEQQVLLKHAARLDVDCIVAEVMSIHPENHIVESQQILKPDIVVVSNTWPDHIDAQGTTEDEIAATLCLDIPEEATVFVPSVCDSRVFQAAVTKLNGKLVVIDDDVSQAIRKRIPRITRTEFAENIDLVCGVAKHLEIEDKTIADGLISASRDIGALAIRELPAGAADKRIFLVNAFAANDPESTIRVLAKARDSLPKEAPVVGLLCLRSDRADRTSQWIETLGNGLASEFDRLYVTGGHSRVVARRVRLAERLKGVSAKDLTATIVADAECNSIVMGFGNFVGIGNQLSDYWNRTGVAYGV